MRTFKIIVPDDFDPETFKVYCERPTPDDSVYGALLEPIPLEIWKPHYRDLLDKGFLGMVDFMGGDESVVNAARVSYGRGTRRVSEDPHLIRYLIRHKHWSPVEMVEIMWHVRAPIFVFRQWHRHRMASINEYSGRYSELTDDMYMPALEDLEPQSTANRQGRGGELSENNRMALQIQFQSIFNQTSQAYKYALGHTNVPDDSLQLRFQHIREETMKKINDLKKRNPDWADPTEEMIEDKTTEIFLACGLYATDEDFWGNEKGEGGVAREIARIVLPLATYSEMYWKSDLRNTFNFVSLRSDPHAQKEIRVYSDAMLEMLEPIAPVCVAAFGDYILRGRQFSRFEMEVAKVLYKRYGHMNITEPAKFVEEVMTDLGASKRETREFIQVLEG
jgi:thymidylate synthase (FAD)